MSGGLLSGGGGGGGFCLFPVQSHGVTFLLWLCQNDSHVHLRHNSSIKIYR